MTFYNAFLSFVSVKWKSRVECWVWVVLGEKFIKHITHNIERANEQPKREKNRRDFSLPARNEDWMDFMSKGLEISSVQQIGLKFYMISLRNFAAFTAHKAEEWKKVFHPPWKIENHNKAASLFFTLSLLLSRYVQLLILPATSFSTRCCFSQEKEIKIDNRRKNFGCFSAASFDSKQSWEKLWEIWGKLCLLAWLITKWLDKNS